MNKLQIKYIKLSDTQIILQTNGDVHKLSYFASNKYKFFEQCSGKSFYDTEKKKFDIGTRKTWILVDFKTADDKDSFLNILTEELKKYNLKSSENSDKLLEVIILE